MRNNIIITANNSDISSTESNDVANLSYQKKVCRDVLEICRPIFKMLNITFFSHSRAFHNGQFASLISSTELTEYYIKKKYPIKFSDGKGYTLEPGYYIADYTDDEAGKKVLGELRDLFHTDHFLYIIDKQNKYDDMYVFATTPNNHRIVNHYVNDRELINHFLLYYKDKSARLLKNSTTVKYSKEYFADVIDFEKASNIAQKNSQEFLDLMPIKKIQIKGHRGEVLLSKREFECFKYIVKNYTLKEIGKQLKLSPRTVQTYLNNLKVKLGCEQRTQLIEIAQETYLL